jgi:hypothetical protein
MKLLTTLLLSMTFCASIASADQGLNLYVGDCSAGSITTSVTNACTTNTGTVTTVFGSIILPAVTRVGFVGTQSVLDVGTSAATLPDWWRADACRAAAFSIAGDAAMGGSCPTLWDVVPPAGSNLTGQYGLHGPDGERLLLGTVLASTDAYDLVGDGQTELSIFKLTILRTKTVGTGSCAGCLAPVTLMLNEVNVQTLTDSPATFLRITAPIANNWISYNAGFLPVAAKNRTWGAVKALYR